MNTMHRRRKNRKEIILIFFRIVSLIVIIACLIYIYLWFMENKRNSNIISEVADSTIIDTITIQIPDFSNEDNLHAGEQNVEITAYELDFEKLLSINSSTIGWICVPNTTINYPVAQHSDNSFYLNHSFDKSYNSAGWIFADYRNKFDGTDKNIIFYGHNRMDSSMFASLRNTQKQSWYDNPINKYLTFTTTEGIQVYEVFSVYTIKAETYYLTTNFNSDDDYVSFLNTLKKRSIHNFGVNLSAKDCILTLSTCDSSGRSRVILHARKIL